MNKEIEKCIICKNEFTSIHTEVTQGVKIYVCLNCLESAKEHFIWVCMGCGMVYRRPKRVVIHKLKHAELKRAYMLCEEMQIIQGIDACIHCEPESIMEAMEKCQVGNA